nr:immunoglobulin light chain junction region [Macaca mulatta]
DYYCTSLGRSGTYIF